jgi:biopolymer transport protein ExbB
LARLLLVAYDHLDEPREETIELLQTRARQEVSKLERGLVVLEVVVGVAPLLGLVGTIHGLIGMFGDLGKAGLANNAELAKGISIALNTTFMGLIVAIPSLTAWSFFNRRVENLTVELENLCDKFVRQQYRIRTRP